MSNPANLFSSANTKIVILTLVQYIGISHILTMYRFQKQEDDQTIYDKKVKMASSKDIW